MVSSRSGKAIVTLSGVAICLALLMATSDRVWPSPSVPTIRKSEIFNRILHKERIGISSHSFVETETLSETRSVLEE